MHLFAGTRTETEAYGSESDSSGLERNMTDPCIRGACDMILKYRSGKLTLREASSELNALTGLSMEVAEKVLRGIKRDNVRCISSFTRHQIGK